MIIKRETTFGLGDQVYFNYPEGEQCRVIGIVVFKSHVEYLVFSENGTKQLMEDQLSESKVF